MKTLEQRIKDNDFAAIVWETCQDTDELIVIARAIAKACRAELEAAVKIAKSGAVLLDIEDWTKEDPRKLICDALAAAIMERAK